MRLYIALFGALIICQNKAENSPNVKNQENDNKIPVAVQSEPNIKREATEVNATPVTPGATSESGLKQIRVSMVNVENNTEQAVALNGGGIQNIAVNNLVDEHDTTNDGKPQINLKEGIIDTSTVNSDDANEKVLIENDVVLTGNGVADTAFVADDVVDETVTKSNAQNGKTTVRGNAQFGKDIQARATDDTSEKRNKNVSTEENKNTKGVKASNFHFETKLDSSNGENKLVSVNLAMKNKQTSTIVFQVPVNIYVDHVNKKTGFITRLKQTETSTASDVSIAKKIKELIKKSKENVKEEANTTGNSSLAQKPKPTKVDNLRNK